MVKRALCGLGLLALAACTAQQGGEATRLGASPTLTGGTYSTGGGITIASELREVGGRLALCGAWSESTSQIAYSKGTAFDVVSSGTAYLGADPLVTGLGFLRRTPPTAEYGNVAARCAVTERPWRPAYASTRPDIRLPRKQVYVDAGSPGIRINFLQTGPGALGGAPNLVEVLFPDVIRIPLDASATVAQGRYSSGGSVRVAATLRQIGDAAYVCGVWRTRGATSRYTEHQAPEVLARAAVTAGGQEVIRDLRFMRRMMVGGPLRQSLANCKDTGRSWADVGAGGRLAIRLPEMIVHYGPGTPITFRPHG